MTHLIKRAATGMFSIFGVGMMTIAAFSAIDQARTKAQAQATVDSWPAASRQAASALLAKYGAPDSAGAKYLSWRLRGEWTRVSVYRDDEPAKRNGIVEDVVRFEAPLESWRDLKDLGLGVRYEAIGETLSAASASEQANTLALNLAVDVIKGRRTAREARDFYAKAQKLAAAGKSSDYALSLKFEPAQGPPAIQPGEIWPWPYTRGFKLEPGEAPPPTQPQAPSPLWSLP